jgi:hypothetical protein
MGIKKDLLVFLQDAYFSKNKKAPEYGGQDPLALADEVS